MVGLAMAFNPGLQALLGAKVGQMNNPFNILSNSVHSGADAASALVKMLYGPQAYQDQHTANTARVANLNENTRLMPIDTAVTAQNALNQMGRLSQSQNRFGQAYQMARTLQMMPPAARASWIAQNKDAFTGMLAVLANKVGQQNQTPTPQVLNTSWLQQQLNIPQNNQSSSGLASLAMPSQQQVALPPQNAQAPNTVQQPANSTMTFQATPQIADAVGRASQLDANNKLVTTNIRQRLEGAQIFENLQKTPEFQQGLKALAMYPGPGGKTQLAVDMVSNPVRYQQYNAAMQQLLPLVAGSISQMEGFAKTNEGLKTGLNFLKKGMGFAGSDPQAALTYINRGLALLNSEYKSIKSAGQPLYKVDINTPSASGGNKKKPSAVSNSGHDPLGIL
jgi:hypothetical protein